MTSPGGSRKSGLRKEAERLRRLMEEAAQSSREGSPDRKLLTFALGDHRYGIPLESLEEVLPPPALAQVPGAPEHVLGVASVRGEVVPILDPARMFGLEPAVPSEGARVLLLGGRRDRVGLLVARVADVVSYQVEDLEPASEDRRLEGILDRPSGTVKIIHADRLLEEAAEGG